MVLPCRMPVNRLPVGLALLENPKRCFREATGDGADNAGSLGAVPSESEAPEPSPSGAAGETQITLRPGHPTPRLGLVGDALAKVHLELWRSNTR